MKYPISGTPRGVISLPYELIEELGAEHEGFGDVVIKEGKLTFPLLLWKSLILTKILQRKCI